MAAFADMTEDDRVAGLCPLDGALRALYKALMANLFEAAGLEKSAPRPLADRLRPKSLSEVVGQDHIVGSDGTLTRMLKSGRVPSLIFWGTPGFG